ncbi:zeta toxin family protein [Spirosoma sp. KNUC1025]|uniref:zeta toxin family protein n=1 Tax=Spirosoma sp. KNUC1025 TaxID=2894082 RepID=UPI0038632CFA
MDIHHVTEEELDIARQIVFAEYIGDATVYQSDKPIGILLGGQPASGKTGLIKQLRRTYSNRKFVVINGDEYRQFHPRARMIGETFGQDAPKYTQPFSNALVEYLKSRMPSVTM